MRSSATSTACQVNVLPVIPYGVQRRAKSGSDRTASMLLPSLCAPNPIGFVHTFRWRSTRTHRWIILLYGYTSAARTTCIGRTHALVRITRKKGTPEDWALVNIGACLSGPKSVWVEGRPSWLVGTERR